MPLPTFCVLNYLSQFVTRSNIYIYFPPSFLQRMLNNLTQELGDTSLISSSRLQQIESVLMMLEETATSNQVEVDLLTEKVR